MVNAVADVNGNAGLDPKPPGKLDGLTSLRFFAASMIVVQHSWGFLGISEETAARFPLHQGVSFFFVLSGFILAYVYQNEWGKSSRAKFFVARFARIYPVHLFSFFLVLLLLPKSVWVLADTPDWRAATANLLLVQSWIPIWHFFASFNSPAWSISTEFFFYLAFPLLIVVPAWRGLLVSALLVIGTIAFAVIAHLPYGKPADPFVTASGLLYNFPLPRLFEFAVGVATCRAWRAWGSRLASRRTATLLECGAILLIGISLLSSPPVIAALVGLMPPLWRIAVGTYLGGTSSALPFALLIFVVACERGAITKALCRPSAVRLGEQSFSLYMIHGTMFIFYDAHKAAFAALPVWVRYLGFWIVLLVAASLVWQFVEVPCRRRVVAWHGQRRSEARSPWTVGDWFSTGAGSGIGIRSIAHLFVFYLMCVGIGWAIKHPPSSIHPVGSFAVADAMRPNLLEQPVTFAPGLQLTAAHVRKGADGQLFLDLQWQARSDQQLVHRVAVHLLDASSEIMGQADYDQDAARAVVREGSTWIDSPALPRAAYGATKLGIAVFEGDVFLLAGGGSRDWGDRRLIVPLPVPLNRF